ncbi:MAG: hypothetical protein M3Z37_09725, partial [Candidatus Eremiobacteraeota bacterium]|nr:hypothetical protein [Candidatus Eremiobacteraeota bacterium]
YGPRGPGAGRPYGGRPDGRRRGFTPDGHDRDRAPAPRKLVCPPEYRDAYLEARDFLAGLIATLGLPARLSFGGIDPARDGRQLTIDVHAIDGGASTYRRGTRDERGEPGDLAILIGKHGAMIDALSAITNAVMHRGDSRELFFSVDVEGYRERRIATLRAIAQRCATRVLREGVALELEPMPPAERRIIHLALAANRGLATESTGVGSQRRVVILPRDSAPPSDRDVEEFD